MNFSDKVKQVVRQIPKGHVMTYKEVAVASGHPRSARAVANVMANNFDADIPCHRVVRTDGTLGGYNQGGTEVKRRLLTQEGAIL